MVIRPAVPAWLRAAHKRRPDFCIDRTRRPALGRPERALIAGLGIGFVAGMVTGLFVGLTF
jgi:hypothetical protein